MFAVETDTGTWIAAAIGAIALVVPVAIYVFTRGRRRVEYVVLTNASLLPGRVANELEVSRDGAVVPAPALTITRIVNVGNQEIRTADFESDLTVTFEGAEEVVSATWSASRPPELRPAISIEGNQVNVAPALLNAGDMLELQVLSSGKPEKVTVSGRVAGVTLAQRAALPYPPGSGREGEMDPGDRFMWYLATPAAIIGGGIAFVVADNMTTLGRWLTALATVVVLCGYLLLTRYLVKRRRRWRPY